MIHASSTASGSPSEGRRRPARACFAVSLAIGAVVVLAPGAAEAAIPDGLRPGSRPFSLLVGLGPSVGIRRSPCYEGNYYWSPLYAAPGPYALGCGGAIKVSQIFAAHFSGNASGPSLGLLVQEELLRAGYFGLVVAPRFAWDIQVRKDLGLYIAPNVALGYHLSAWRGFAPAHGADVQGGVMTKLILQDRIAIWAQLPHFDFVFAPGTFIARYDFLLGAGVTF